VPYATQAELETRFGTDELVQLTNRAGGNTIDAAVVASALVGASSEIDGYLARRYAVPVSPAPVFLGEACLSIARYKLHGKSAGDAVRRDYDDAIRLLRDLADGRAEIAGAAPPASSSVAGQVRIDAPGRQLSRDQLADFTR
jgi:phage gp36-like protein